VTFIQKLQEHRGGLVRLNVGHPYKGVQAGDVGMICDEQVLGDRGEVPSLAWVTLFINGSVERYLLHETDIQLL